MAATLVWSKLISAAALAALRAQDTTPQSAPPQNPSYFNPQIAIVGDFAAVLADNVDKKRHADFREIEINFAADADPYLKVFGVLSVAKNDETDKTEVEAEEVYG